MVAYNIYYLHPEHTYTHTYTFIYHGFHRGEKQISIIFDRETDSIYTIIQSDIIRIEQKRKKNLGKKKKEKFGYILILFPSDDK